MGKMTILQFKQNAFVINKDVYVMLLWLENITC